MTDDLTIPDTEQTAFFIDKEGRQWILDLNVGVIEDVQKQAGVDLEVLIKEPRKFAMLIMEEPKKLVMALWVLCKDQAETYGIDSVKFGKLFGRDIIDKATDALLGAVCLFYPRGAAGRVMKARLPDLIKKMDDELAKSASRVLDRELSNIATKSREVLG